MNSHETQFVLAKPPQLGDLILGRFRLMAHIGNGGMGTVFLATDISLSYQKVALKFLNSHLAYKPSSLTRLKNEVYVSRKLNHPNLVRTFSLDCSENGHYFIAMEYVDGMALSSLLDSLPNRILPWQESVRIISQIASGLEHAHQLNIIHRDLKPENILLTKEGTVKVADFGLARILDLEQTVTKAGEALGTPYYMAPEQFRSEKVEATSDIYSLGILAYELLTGEKPFNATSYFSLALQHLGDDLPEIRNSNIPNALRELIYKCSAKEISDRWISMSDILDVLKTISSAQPIANWTKISQGYKTHRRLKSMRIFARKARDFAVKFIAVVCSLFCIYIFIGTLNDSQKERFSLPLIWADSKLPLQVFRPIRSIFGYGFIDTHNPARSITEYARNHNDGEVWAAAKTLLRSRLYFEWADSVGNSMLHLAMPSEPYWANYLLEGGADCSAQNKFGQTPIFQAIQIRRLDTIELLVPCTDFSKAEYNYGQSAVMTAVDSEQISILTLILKQPLSRKIINQKNFGGETALARALHASKANRSRMISMLINAGADPTVLDNNFASPLMLAAFALQPDAVSALLSKRRAAQLEQTDNNDQNALMYAAMSSIPNTAAQLEVIRLLLEAGIDPLKMNKDGFKASGLSASRKNLPVQKYLEEAEANALLKEQ